MIKPKKGEVRKPTKTLSGITPVAVMLPPRRCEHGTCVYCPSMNVPQSYTPKSPVVMRASRVNYDSYKQVRARLKAFEVMNHPTEKVEIIIMGGTFLEYDESFQNKFVKGIYDGLNGKKSRSLARAQKLNERAKCRCVALCVETRPDVCVEFIERIRGWGVTRVELGVQIIDDKIYEKIKRGHKVSDVIRATRELKNAGFKIGYHIMPGLPGSNLKKDLNLFKKLFNDSDFCPDQLKIYPCQVMPSSELEGIYWAGNYKPYTKEEIEKLLIKMLGVVPRYCRVMRVMREIPPEYIVAGTTRIDLRRDVEKYLRNKKIKLKEIRFREIGFNAVREFDNSAKGVDKPTSAPTRDLARSSVPAILLPRNRSPTHSAPGGREKLKSNSLTEKLKLKTTKYRASGGDEYFLEIVDENDILFGLCRLRIFDSGKIGSLQSRSQLVATKSLDADFSAEKSVKSITKFRIKGSGEKSDCVKGKIGVIRELHVYGKALKLGEEGKVGQHRGFGKELMEKAEEICRKNKIAKLSVISGIGVREYYKKLGYKLEDTYMVKFLR